MINGGKDYCLHHVSGGMFQTQLRCFLLNYNMKPLTLWMSRHGESAWNHDQRIGGNPDLSPQGERYSKALGKFGITLIF
jgi:6-phosphofructo-2-kinase